MLSNSRGRSEVRMRRVMIGILVVCLLCLADPANSNGLFSPRIPSYVLGAQYGVTFGPLYDPIGPSISANLAGVCFLNLRTCGANLQLGRQQAQPVISNIALFSGNVYDFGNFLISLQNQLGRFP
jgi:hypothetical protein